MLSHALAALVRLATVRIGPEHPSGNETLEVFRRRCAEMPSPRVLELGTARVDPAVSTRRDSWVPHASQYLGSDAVPGVDVDIVADVHKLASVTGDETFDVVIACSTFEHYKYPHLAAHQVMRALKVGGIVFVHTHQTFPLHGHPRDYFRFSREALAGCFGVGMGMRILSSDYEYPARIVGRHDPHAALAPAYMYVRLVAEKVSQTPINYVFDLDSVHDQ
jgi:SAM-dependent methyltransferase